MKSTALMLVLFFLTKTFTGQTLTRDISFNDNLATTNTSVRNIAVYDDQRILICGDFSNYNGVLHQSLIRLLSNGQPDPTFLSPVVNGVVHSIGIQPWNNKVIIGGGFTMVNGVPMNGLARFNDDGSLDATFNIGTGISSAWGGDLSIRSVSIADNIDPAKRYIYAGGQFQAFNGFATGIKGGLVRLKENGSRDIVYNPQVTNGPVYTTKFDSAGKLLIGGEFWNIAGVQQVRIARLNIDGTRDLTFNTGAFGPYSSVTGIGIDASGKILLGGWFTKFNGVDYNHIIRLNSNGSIDNTFNTGSGLENGLSLNTNGTEARTFAFLDDGSIVVGGNFTSFNGTSCGNIVCLNDTGGIATWKTGTGFDDNVMNLQLQEAVAGEKRILVAGFFESYQSYTQGTVMRLVPMLSVLYKTPGSHEKDSRSVRTNVAKAPRLYPVPAARQVFLETSFPKPECYSVAAYAFNGALLKQWAVTIPAGIQKTTFNISNINANYFILIMKNQNHLLQFKVLKD
jgi:uncharacterized delta-60 repeat protein